MPLSAFSKSLQTMDIDSLRQDTIGENMTITTPWGDKALCYADYTASGRALEVIEDFIRYNVLPHYANCHTEASHCGQFMNQIRQAARQNIARLTRCEAHDSVIFSGAGATSAVNRLVHLSAVNDYLKSDIKPLVLVGPYEHHSNILPWRESCADVIEIDEAINGGPDLEQLRDVLQSNQHRPLLIGSFSAASNVTGLLVDSDEVTHMLKSHGALAFWDYAAAGPYVDISMANPSYPGSRKDAVFFSTHKFLGGPAASGVLLINEGFCEKRKPTWSGGGTVQFVSPWQHVYSDSLSTREEAGTPNIIGDIRAALVMLVKEHIGISTINQREEQLAQRGLQSLGKHRQIELLGLTDAPRLPIFSFRVRDRQGKPIHHQLFTRMMSDIHGIQARGGCACAGPYAHRLLNISHEQSISMLESIQQGQESAKPGWVRLNFTYAMDDATVTRIIHGVLDCLEHYPSYQQAYDCDERTARFSARAQPMMAAL